MKIVVDKLPNKPQDCRYAELRGNRDYQWYGCKVGSIGCEVDKKGCPFYTDIKTAMKEMVGDDK
jgi:hypothetical protein